MAWRSALATLLLDLDVEVVNGALRLAGGELSDAISIGRLHSLLGAPSRIVEPAQRAPAGHRNNQIHIYDALGIICHEHHYTRLVEGIAFVFWPDEAPAFAPAAAFAGRLTVFGLPLEAGMTGAALSALPCSFEPGIGGSLSYEDDKISVIIDTKGKKLPSGRRSKSRQVVSVAVGLAHDPWQKPSP